MKKYIGPGLGEFELKSFCPRGLGVCEHVHKAGSSLNTMLLGFYGDSSHSYNQLLTLFLVPLLSLKKLGVRLKFSSF